MRSDCAVDVDPGAADVRQNALIRCWVPSRVMLGRQAVDRHDNVQLVEPVPTSRNSPECTGHDLSMDSKPIDLWQEQFELAMPHKRIAAHERDVERLMFFEQ